jgi:protein-disulfide isomerase
MGRKATANPGPVPVTHRDHIIGTATAAVTLIEYGDYECPYCGQAHVVVQELWQELGGQMCFVYRHFPLAIVHVHAEHAAEAAEAAMAQGKFWPMHEIMFEHQEALEDSDLVLYAAALRLDVERFSNELANHVHAARVREDFLSGARAGVNGTPTFFINGVRHDDSFDYETMLAAIVDAIDSATD